VCGTWWPPYLDGLSVQPTRTEEGSAAIIAPVGGWCKEVQEDDWWEQPVRPHRLTGFGSKANVYDEGVGNTLVGVNSVQGNPPGPAIRDAMKRKIEMLKSNRRP